jgi:hypothetical protein
VPAFSLRIHIQGETIMADEPKPPVPVEEFPGMAGGTSAVASASAPFIFVNAIPNFGFNDGIICLTLEAFRYNSVQGQVLLDKVVVGHLRMAPMAYQHLKHAIENIDLMMAKPNENKIN